MHLSKLDQYRQENGMRATTSAIVKKSSRQGWLVSMSMVPFSANEMLIIVRQ